MAKFLSNVIENRVSKDDISYKIWTNAGIIVPKITTDGLVTVDMGARLTCRRHLNIYLYILIGKPILNAKCSN